MNSNTQWMTTRSPSTKKSRHRKSPHLLEVIEHLLLARDKHFHSPAQRLQILLHRRIFCVELTDGFDELALLDQGDELLDAFTAGHVDFRYVEEVIARLTAMYSPGRGSRLCHWHPTR